jgi:UDP-N-acetylglucosamine 4-epimerase
MTAYSRLRLELESNPRSWLVTGAAGFIGSNIVEELLRLGQRVTGMDNFAAGRHANLEEIKNSVSGRQWDGFTFIEGDIRNLEACQQAAKGADYILHQAALGSVPKSIEDPAAFNANNVSGFLHMLLAARDQMVRRFVYASSSAVYGDDPTLPKKEEILGHQLSPYAATKYFNEIYAEVFARCYGLPSIGLRYFNIFGQRQDPEGAYAAVIPQWLARMIQNQEVSINGDGETSRDFCHVQNAVQANLLAATTQNNEAVNQAFNVAVSARTTLNELFEILRVRLAPYYPHLKEFKPVYRDFRPGDVRHSQADISKAVRLLGYAPTHSLETGLDAALDWYRRNARAQRPS